METKDLKLFGNLKEKSFEKNVTTLKRVTELKKEIESLLKRNEVNKR